MEILSEMWLSQQKKEEEEEELCTQKKYRVCHEFRFMKWDDYFKSILTTFEASIIF